MNVFKMTVYFVAVDIVLSHKINENFTLVRFGSQYVPLLRYGPPPIN